MEPPTLPQKFGVSYATTKKSPIDQNRREASVMKAVIYARYSSDLQSKASIEDQVRVCRERADKMEFEVVDVFTDPALSGSRLQNRPSIQKLLERARAPRIVRCCNHRGTRSPLARSRGYRGTVQAPRSPGYTHPYSFRGRYQRAPRRAQRHDECTFP